MNRKRLLLPVLRPGEDRPCADRRAAVDPGKADQRPGQIPGHGPADVTGWPAGSRTPDPGPGGQPQPQAPPQQPPPPPDRGSAPLDLPPTETVDSSFTVSSCPSGHVHGADASLIGRLRSNEAPQARQRYS